MLTASTTALLFAGSSIALTLGVAAWLVERQRTVAVTLWKFGTRPKLYELAPEQHAASSAQRPLPTRPARSYLKPLSAAEATRFSQRWYILQCRFVDNPKSVVAEADLLVRELLETRGHLDAGRENDIDHSTLVTTYIAAQAITTRPGGGEVDTEMLRKALVYYRALLTELLVDR